jgi:hypothetical protein
MERHEGQNIERTDPGMDPLMLPQIDMLHGESGSGQSRRFNRLRGTDERHDGPVVIGVRGPVENLDLVPGDLLD